MGSSLSIYHPPGRLTSPDRPFGKDVANVGLFRALARHGGFDGVDLLGAAPVTAEHVIADLGPAPAGTELRGGVVLHQNIPAASGALLRGQPYLAELAWLRRRSVGDGAYSLMGLVHTLAPVAVRQMIADALAAPIQPWDAVICTSPSVQAALAEMLGEWGQQLAERTGGSAPPMPALPVIPLGVDAAALAVLADRPGVRDAVRKRLGVADDGVLLLWVGRLSYFEKAFPQPMFRAAQLAAVATGVKVTFALCGWFPNARDEDHYRAAARRHAPDVDVHFLDGADQDLTGQLWAGADIFLSLVDNIQETFGITPLEAMAAGLPVVASDWDGYRATVRHGIEGFLVPTLLPPPGALGETMVLRTALELDTYQGYAGAVAQHVAVDIGRAAEAIADLIRNPDLRRRMGGAGRGRVAAAFDWPVVARRYRALTDELAAVRAAAPVAEPLFRMNPVKTDPFHAFRGFPSAWMEAGTYLRPAPGVAAGALQGLEAPLDRVFPQWRAGPAECEAALAVILDGGATLGEVLAAFPAARRGAVILGVAWMAKHGLLEWT